ncbi:hypothetical protein LTR08_000163 [Meristemomyces frigidus]|nr:hypothetical protein LTR08_000163 [Meristemomyces frigidus]
MAFYSFTAKLAFFFALLVSVVSATTVRVCNEFADEIHLSWDVNVPSMYKPQDKTLYNTQCTNEDLAANWGGAIFVGLVPNGLDVGDWRNHDTKVELTVGGYENFDFFDVDQEKGASVPVVISVGDMHGGCPVDKLPSCPVEWQMRHVASGPVVQCRNDQTAQAQAFFEGDCPNTYVRFDDIQTKVATVPQQMSVRVGTA